MKGLFLAGVAALWLILASDTAAATSDGPLHARPAATSPMHSLLAVTATQAVAASNFSAPWM